MKIRIYFLIAVLSVPAWVSAQTLSIDQEKKARDLLREVIDTRDRQQRPAQPPIVTKPSVQPQASAPASAELPPTGLRGGKRPLTFAEVEQQYLAGNITAKQFQKYLKDKTLDEPSSGRAAASAPGQAAPQPSASVPNVVNSAEPKEAINAPTPVANAAKPEAPQVPANQQGTLSEVEKKMDELLRLKAEREQEAQKAAMAKASEQAGTPKTKREKMDELLRAFVSGKISEPEYNAQREKLVNEPETK